MTIPIVRQRAKAPKTRTGCKTCRARHIKCDEDRPACQRCLRSNRECPGYEPVAPPRSRGSAATTKALAFVQPKQQGCCNAVSVSPSSTTCSTPTLCAFPRSITVDLSGPELQMLEFFRLETVHQLPGNSWALSWERLALDTGNHEPAVSHAAIALGSLHRGHVDFALEQCTLAMSYAREKSKCLATVQDCPDSDLEVLVLVSLLLFCFEVWRVQDQRALVHLTIGQNILYERMRHELLKHNVPAYHNRSKQRLVKLQVSPRTNMDILLQTLVRVGLDITLEQGEGKFLRPIVTEPMPACFSSLEETTVHLDALATNVAEVSAQLVDSAQQDLKARGMVPENMESDMLTTLAGAHCRIVEIDPELKERMRQNRQDVCRWMSALASVPISELHEAAHLLVQMQVFVLWYEVSTWNDPDPLGVDRFEEQYAHLLGQAERYVDLQRRATPSTVSSRRTSSASYPIDSSMPPAFCLGTSLVSCAAMVVLACRTSSIRKRGVDLLRRVDLQGLNDTAFIVSLLEDVVNMEESCARRILGLGEGTEFQSHQVPVEARIVDIGMEATPFNYKADVVRIFYASYGADGQAWVREKNLDICRNTALTRSWSCEMEKTQNFAIDPALLRCSSA